MNRNKKIRIVDYGVGNFHSILKAFRLYSDDVEITEEPAEIANADGLILPGVGAFGAGIDGLESRGLTGAVKTFAETGKPVMGICLGAQIMLSYGYEFGRHEGLGIIKGSVERFPEIEGVKIPQIGWNSIHPPSDNAKINWHSSVLAPVREGDEMYFVHSFFFKPESADTILAVSSYGGYEFCSVFRKGNIYGCQFHPEKSGEAGLKIIKKFVELI